MSRFTTVDLDAFLAQGRGEGIRRLGEVKESLVHARERDPRFAAVEVADPLGVADEYAARLMEAWVELDVLIESLQTGRSPIRICAQRRLIAAGGARPREPSEAERQIAAQFTIAALCYQAGFVNDDLIERYGEHMNRTRIEALLAVDERQALREEIRTARERLVAYLNSDEYQDPELWDDYLDNTPERLVEGKARVLSHLQPLVLRPGDKDRHLTLPQDRLRAADPDPGHAYLRDVLEASNVAGRVWAAPADLAEVSDGDVDIAFIHAVLAEFVQTYAHRPDSDARYLELVAARMSTITRGARLPRWQVVETPLAPGEAAGFEPVPGQPENSAVTLVQPSATATAAAAAERGTILIEQVIEEGAAYTGVLRVLPARGVAQRSVPAIAAVVQGRTLDIGAFARQIQGTREYAQGMGGVLAGLATLNAAFAVKRAVEGEDSTARIAFDLASATAGVGSAFYELRRLVAHSRGANSKWINFLKQRSFILGAPAALFGGITSGIDAWGNLGEGDLDAAGYGTGAAGLAVAEGAVLGYAAYASWASLTGPPGWLTIALLAGFLSFSLLVAAAEDDPLEVFAKNGPMAQRLRSTPQGAPLRFERSGADGSGAPVPVYAADLPLGFAPYKQVRWQAAHAVYNPEAYPEWDAQAPLEDAVGALIDILHGYRLEDDAVHERDLSQGPAVWALREWKITARFRLFPYRDAELAYQCVCYLNGPGGGVEYLAPSAIDRQVEDGALQAIELTYRLPPALKRRVNADTELLLLTRFGFERGSGENRVLPPSPDSEPRYQAVRTYAQMGPRQGRHAVHGYPARTGTLAQLQDADYWEQP